MMKSISESKTRKPFSRCSRANRVNPAGRSTVLAETRAVLAKRPAAYPEVIATSSEKSQGIAELRAGIARILAERG